MNVIFLLLLLYLTTPSWAQDENDLFSINADEVRTDGSIGVTTYEGNAWAEVSNLVIEAETISVFRDNGSLTRIEAGGDPLKLRRQTSADQLSGTAQRIVFSVPELRLTLVDYVIADSAGNNIKGKEATFVLSP